jgi:hypothetical protein
MSETFERGVLGLHEDMGIVYAEYLGKLSRLTHRLGQAEGMLEVCAGILRHGDTEEKRTSKKIFEFLKNTQEKYEGK